MSSPHLKPTSPQCLDSLARQPSSLLIIWRGAVRLDRCINHTSVECQKQASEAESLQRDHRCSSKPWLPVRVPFSLRLFQAWSLSVRLQTADFDPELGHGKIKKNQPHGGAL